MTNAITGCQMTIPCGTCTSCAPETISVVVTTTASGFLPDLFEPLGPPGSRLCRGCKRFYHHKGKVCHRCKPPGSSAAPRKLGR